MECVDWNAAMIDQFEATKDVALCNGVRGLKFAQLDKRLDLPSRRTL